MVIGPLWEAALIVVTQIKVHHLFVHFIFNHGMYTCTSINCIGRSKVPTGGLFTQEAG